MVYFHFNKLADSSIKCNKDKLGDELLKMHHGHVNSQVADAQCQSTPSKENDTKFIASYKLKNHKRDRPVTGEEPQHL